MSAADFEDDLGLSSDSDRPESLAGQAAGAGDEADFQEYAKSLGLEMDVDADLLWVAREAFVMPLPTSWSEHSDAEGRIYFFHQGLQESSWSHPMDNVFREVIRLIKTLRRLDPPEANIVEAVQAHLQSVHDRATAALDGWSGPYTSEEGQYFYHAGRGMSSWDNPVDEWRNELALRQQVLHRCLLHGLDHEAQPSAGTSSLGNPTSDAELMPLPALPLNLARPSADSAEPPVPTSARSFATCISARSTCSVRSVRRLNSSNPISPRVALADASSAKREAEKGSSANGRGDERLAADLAEASGAGKGVVADEDDLEITFGHTSGLALPKFGN
eukprot:gb/GFBE01064820.1/.p1 GENE.gb/GFBE01064820.1/~~gb/GFBE01064820.1/.p1  ORF type:complete len:332 (+),score=68.88 gb/GFBE01064820.1/:1-996(+)